MITRYPAALARHCSTVSRSTGFSRAAATLSLSLSCLLTIHIVVSKKLTFLVKKKDSTPTSMLALMRARLDENVDFETIRETAKKANSYTKAYSKG